MTMRRHVFVVLTVLTLAGCASTHTRDMPLTSGGAVREYQPVGGVEAAPEPARSRVSACVVVMRRLKGMRFSSPRRRFRPAHRLSAASLLSQNRRFHS